MLLRIFKSTGAQMLVLIPLIGVLLWLHAFIHPPQITFLYDTFPMPSYKLMSEIIPHSSVLGSIITFGMILLQGAMLVRLNTQFIFINNRTYLPAFFFVLITASIPVLQRLNPVVFSSFFLLLALEQLFNAYRQEKIAYEIFAASFFLSLGATFYPYLIFFMFTIWTGLIILRPFRWREWVFSIIGFFTPWFFVFSYYYLIRSTYEKVYDDFIMVFKTSYVFPAYSVLSYVFASFILLLILLASQFIIKEFTGKKILTRKVFMLFLWLFVNIAGVFFLVAQASAELIYIVAIPIAYLLSHYFNFMKSTFWGDVFLGILLLLVVLIQLKTW